MKTTKMEEAVKYLSCCRILESEAYSLYNIASKKIDRSEISSITLAIAHDCLKHSKVIQELFKPITGITTDFNQCNKDLKKVLKEIQKFSGELTTIDTISENMLPEFFKGLAELEDFLYEIYSFFLDSPMIKEFADGLSVFYMVAPENLTFIVKCLREDNQKHREMLIESLYFFNKSQMKKNENPAPFVKYQNPDRWVIT